MSNVGPLRCAATQAETMTIAMEILNMILSSSAKRMESSSTALESTPSWMLKKLADELKRGQS